MLDRINKEGVAVLAIEQNARIALQHSQYAYALEVGEVVLEGPSAELRENQEVQDLYMGGGGDSREAYATIRREGLARAHKRVSNQMQLCAVTDIAHDDTRNLNSTGAT